MSTQIGKQNIHRVARQRKQVLNQASPRRKKLSLHLEPLEDRRLFTVQPLDVSPVGPLGQMILEGADTHTVSGAATVDYSLNLKSGQVLTLDEAANAGGTTLSLYKPSESLSGSPGDSSRTVTVTGANHATLNTIPIDEDGTWIIRVATNTGATSFNLTGVENAGYSAVAPTSTTSLDDTQVDLGLYDSAATDANGNTSEFSVAFQVT